MPSPFPGMDPYLEDRSLWPEVHHYLISNIGVTLTSQVAPRYLVRIEERVMPIGDDDPALGIIIPDISVHRADHPAPTREGGTATSAPTLTAPVFMMDELREAFLEIRAGKDGKIVTVIEVLSPSNKVVGSGLRNLYLDKRRRWLKSDVHFVEIDLLRGGQRPNPIEVQLRPSDYRIVVSPVEKRPMADYWLFNLRDSIPAAPIPLAGGDAPVNLDLGKILDEVYERARYDLQIDYAAPAPPPELPSEDVEWAKSLLDK